MNQYDDEDGGLPDAAFTEDQLAAGVQHLMRGSNGPKPRYDASYSRSSCLKKAEAYVLTENDAPLFDALCSWRKEKAREQDVPLYAILHDTTLNKLVERKPQALAELIEVLCFVHYKFLSKRIGRTKAERYSEGLLALLTQPYPVTLPAINGHSSIPQCGLLYVGSDRPLAIHDPCRVVDLDDVCLGSVE